METRKVFKSGNSLVVSLPKEVIDTLAIREGQPLGFEIIIGGVTIKPLCNSRPKGIIKKIAGCLKDDKLAQEILSLRDEDDREVESID
ncbi:MAG: AbrB/MazE/SpoVT family DNA-binding domain-containing protein [Thermincola sp.]|jgi:antitoxin component of MazEF toxin-antitoxin module|nr:AbrB/MazE/SpoVT family DNA-binding domain-containing protein [Thermincola sp.]MDT3703531.1 AbrB/MazE/SpoVT family DNA-binding domain-containing protein [Thermincola sp.]